MKEKKSLKKAVIITLLAILTASSLFSSVMLFILVERNNSISSDFNKAADVANTTNEITTLQEDYKDCVTGRTGTLEKIFLNCKLVKVDTIWNQCPNDTLVVETTTKDFSKKTPEDKKRTPDLFRGPGPDDSLKDTNVWLVEIEMENNEAKDTAHVTEKSSIIFNQNNQWNYFGGKEEPKIDFGGYKKRSIFWPAAMTAIGTSGLLLNGTIITNVYRSDRNFPDKAPELIFRDKTRNTGIDIASGLAVGTGLFFLTRNIILNHKDKKAYEKEKVKLDVTNDGLTLSLNLNKRNNK